MNIAIDSKLLKKSLAKFKKIISTKQYLPDVIYTIKFEASGTQVKLTANNLEIFCEETLSCVVQEKGGICLNFKELAIYSRNMIGNISFSVVNNNNVNKCTIESNNTTFIMDGIDTEDFPIIPILENSIKTKINTDFLFEIFDKCQAHVQPKKYNNYEPINCIFLEFGNNFVKAIATDGRRLIQLKRAGQFPKASMFIIPACIDKLKAWLKDQKELNLEFVDRWLYISGENFRCGFSLIEGQYPNVEDVIHPEIDQELKVDGLQLLNAIKTLKFLSKESSYSSMAGYVRFSLNEGCLFVEGKRYAQDDVIGKTKIDTLSSNLLKPFTFNLNAIFVSDILKSLGANITLKTTNSGIILENDLGDFALIMPIKEENSD